jgi:hypothetical protein
VVPSRLQWRYAPLETEVVCPGSVLETIRLEAVDGFCRLSHGGLETGGILLGKRTDRSIEILAALPIQCEHKLGPSFLLSAADETSLQAALVIDKLGSLQPVGLYISHPRRGFSVTEADVKILDRHFPEPWQLVLILTPEKGAPTRAGFFLRGSVGQHTFVCAHEFSLSAPERPSGIVSEQRPVVTRAFSRISPVGEDVVAQPGAVALASISNAIAPVVEKSKSLISLPAALHGLQMFLTQEQRHWRLSQLNLVGTFILLILVVSAGGLWVRTRAKPPTSVSVHVSDSGSELRIEWDPRHPAVSTASAATLEIRDGGRLPVTIPIGKSGLDNGSALYVPQSDNIEVRLRLMHGSSTPSESVVYFVNPERRVAASVTANPAVGVVPAAKPQAMPAVVAPTAKSQPAPVTIAIAKSQPAPVAVVANAKPESAPVAVVATAKPQPAPVTVVPPWTAEPAPKAIPESRVKERVSRNDKQAAPVRAKTFQLPVHSSMTASDRHESVSLPDLPDIRVNQPSAPIPPLVTDSSILSVLASPTHLTGPPQLRSGHLIWTGTLKKNAVLSFSPAGASAGVLNGRLPGVPVKIALQPAELVDGGIAVYSKDGLQSGAQDPPKAWNGWKVVVNDWDPKRIAEVTVLEAPNPANSWQRLVLRNGNRNVSVVVVDWQRVAGQ